MLLGKNHDPFNPVAVTYTTGIRPVTRTIIVDDDNLLNMNWLIPDSGLTVGDTIGIRYTETRPDVFIADMVTYRPAGHITVTVNAEKKD